MSKCRTNIEVNIDTRFLMYNRTSKQCQFNNWSHCTNVVINNATQRLALSFTMLYAPRPRRAPRHTHATQRFASSFATPYVLRPRRAPRNAPHRRSRRLVARHAPLCDCQKRAPSFATQSPAIVANQRAGELIHFSMPSSVDSDRHVWIDDFIKLDRARAVTPRKDTMQHANRQVGL